MTLYVRRSYEIAIHPHSGIVERLRLPGDPPGINLVHRGGVTGFGALVYTPRDERSAWMARSGPPLDVEAVQFDERRAFARLVGESADRIVCRNPTTGHTLTYVLADDWFDIWLEGELPRANQMGLDLDVAFMDLRQNDPPEYQYTAKCPYRSVDRSLCYVCLARPAPPGMLITALTEVAGWRFRYGRSGVAPMAYRMPMFAVLGMQMLARFDSALDPESRPGPVRMGVRVSFPRDMAEARRSVVRWLGVPIVTAPTLGCAVGGQLAFQVMGPAAGAELTAPDGARTPVRLDAPRDGVLTGRIGLDAEGFHTLRVWNRDNRGSDLVLHAGVSWLETLRRAVAALDEPTPPSSAENSYWAHALCLARKWLGLVKRQDELLADALCRIHMQGLDAPMALPAETTMPGRMPRKGRWFTGAPTPAPHEFLGKTFSPFHLFEHDRVQDAFALIQLYILAADAFSNDAFYEHSVRIAEAHVADNIDETGRVYRLSESGMNTKDYTTVIAPLQALVDLVVEMERRSDSRAGRFREAAARVAGYLVRRGLDFPTEGVSPHRRWTEDGSISCTALSLLYAWHFLERRPEYLSAARSVLDYHEAWWLDVPDVRVLGSSYRYWETQWENDGEGRAINAGHPWTLWRAEALYYWALATGDAARLLQSWNGYLTNFCKHRPDGVTYSCFTPDYIPDRPRRFALTHSYPQKPDRSIAFYLWPRSAATWMRSAALVDASAGSFTESLGPVALNGSLVRENDVLTLKPGAPFFERLFVLSGMSGILRIHAERPVELLCAPEETEIMKGRLAAEEAPCEHGRRSGRLFISPDAGTIELRLGCR